MNVHFLRVALRLLRQRHASADPNRKSVIRVAARWLFSALGAEYDVMLRLQVLEGAAGIREGAWWKKGRAGLAPAKAHFENAPVDPAWFAPAQSPLFGIVNNITRAAIQRARVTVEPFDLINNALMGIPLSAENPGQVLRPAYEAGKAAENGIKTGKETPESIAKGVLGTYIARKVQNEAKHVRREQQIPEDDEGRARDIPDTGHTRFDAGELLSHLIFWNRTDPLGKKIRAFMRRSWAGTPPQKAMDLWLDAVEKGQIPKKQDIAEQAGYAQAISFSRAWNSAWIKFFNDLWQNPTLLKELQQRYEREGVEWFQQKPDIEDLVTQRKRTASVARILAAYLTFP